MRPARRQRAHLLADRVERGDDRVGVPRDDAADRRAPCCAFMRTAAVSERRSWCASSESRRSAIQRTPSRPLHRRADEVHRAGRRRRDHDVDALGARDAQRRRDRGQVPRRGLVRDDQPARQQPRLRRARARARLAVQFLRRPASPRPEVAHAVHPRLRRRQQLVVHVDPLRVVRCEHVRLDPERGQVRRELQRALHAAAARRREVERDDEDLHGSEPVEGEARVLVYRPQRDRRMRHRPRDDEPARAVAARDREIAGASRTRITSSRRSYGLFCFVSATCSGGAATMSTGAAAAMR